MKTYLCDKHTNRIFTKETPPDYKALLGTGIPDLTGRVSFEGNVVAFNKDLFVLYFDKTNMQFTLINDAKEKIPAVASVLRNCEVLKRSTKSKILPNKVNSLYEPSKCRKCPKKCLCIANYGSMDTKEGAYCNMVGTLRCQLLL